MRTGASTRNWDSYGDAIDLPEDLADWRRDLLCDPQTSGGLLIAVDPAEAQSVLAQARKAGFEDAAIVGRLAAGEARVTVR